jgi:hypothetical protein
MLSAIIASFLLLGSELQVAEPSKPEAVIGEASYRFGPFKLYTATLLAESEVFSWDEPFALDLKYQRKIPAEKLANASIIEMARISKRPEDDFEFLRSELEVCFGDVIKGDKIKGVKVTENKAVFYKNDALNCKVEAPKFSTDFFAIWLSPDSRYPKKTKQLLGQYK